MTVTVFLGPSLPADACREILPDAVVRPPAEQGDLLTAWAQDGADVLVLIDGTFHHNLSVWHNEVCYLLANGLRVFGASSMGALRAAETHTFGTVGVGRIFEWYRDGVVTGDDEVALLHGPPESGYRAMSLPMVNVRASLDGAVAEGRMERACADRVVAVTRELYYPDRRLPEILDACRDADLDEPTLVAVREALTDRYVDLKQRDAREVLARVRDLLDGTWEPPAAPPFTFTRSSVFETLYNLDRRVPVGDGSVRLQDVAEYAAVHCPDFAEIRTAALNRDLAVFLGMLLGIRVSPDELAAQIARFRRERALDSDEELARWLRANATTESDLREYLAQEAMCRSLREWVVSARSFDRGARQTLDELRVRGRFEEVATAALHQMTVADRFAEQPEYAGVAAMRPEQVAALHAMRGGVDITPDAWSWTRDAGFDTVDDVVDVLRRSLICEDVAERVRTQVATLLATATADPAPAGDSPRPAGADELGFDVRDVDDVGELREPAQ